MVLVSQNGYWIKYKSLLMVEFTFPFGKLGLAKENELRMNWKHTAYIITHSETDHVTLFVVDDAQQAKITFGKVCVLYFG